MINTASPLMAIRAQVSEIKPAPGIDDRNKASFILTLGSGQKISGIAYRRDAEAILVVKPGTWIQARGVMFLDPEGIINGGADGFLLTSFTPVEDASRPAERSNEEPGGVRATIA